MQDRDLYSRILGLTATWEVTDVKLDAKSGEISVTVAWREGADLLCPECDKCCRGYDRTSRRWRHLDTCQFKTILVADVPRIECHEHGVLLVRAPWAEPGSRLTALMEAIVIDWLRSMGSISAVAKQLRLNWGRFTSHQRRQRVDQCQGPEDQGCRLRLQKPQVLHQHGLFPSRRPQSVSGRGLSYPLEFLKRQ